MLTKLTHPTLIALMLSFCASVPSYAFAFCSDYLEPITLGTVVDPRVNEASGLAASSRYPGVLWTHNDSGDGPTIYALRSDGSLIGRWSVQGASAIDWEDMAMGPCDDGQRRCLYIGDIGNNSRDRADLTIYKVEEPELDPTATVEELQMTKPAVVLPFHYPFGEGDTPDAETLMVSPLGTVYILTKENKGRLLKLPSPQTPNQPVNLELVAQTNLATLTGGDISPGGDRLVVRNYLRVYEFMVSSEDLTTSLNSPYKVFSITAQPQGESMTYFSIPGDEAFGLATLSEKTDQPLIFYRCALDFGLIDDVASFDMPPELDMRAPDLDMLSEPDMRAPVQDMSSPLVDAEMGESSTGAASGGCAGCASAQGSPVWGLWGLALLGVGLARRRRRR